jgi:predicted MFS family arabinose efflux permease
VRETVIDLKTWCWFALLFAISIPSGGISTFGPLIVQSFGFDPFSTMLFNIPFGAVQLIATLGGAFAATKLKRKGPVIAALCVPPIIGCVILMMFPHSPENKATLLVGYYLISVYPGIIPLIYGWSSQNTAGDTKRKCNNAVLFIGQSVGNVIGPQLYTPAEKPGYARGLRSNLALYVVIVVLVCIATLYLGLLNKRHAKKRVELGKKADVYDASLDSSEEVERRRAIASNAAGGAVEGDAPRAESGDKAFENLTDLTNEDFVFVY